MRQVAERRADGERIGTIDLAFQLQRFAIVGFGHGEVAQRRIESRAIVQICGVVRMLLAQLFQQQLAALVVEFLGRRIMTQVGLQKGIRHQAGRIGRVIDSRLPAQDVETFGEEGFRLRIFPDALIGAGEIDAQRAVLFAEILGFRLPLVNGERFLESGDRQIVLTHQGEDAAQRIQALGDARMLPPRTRATVSPRPARRAFGLPATCRSRGKRAPDRWRSPHSRLCRCPVYFCEVRTPGGGVARRFCSPRKYIRKSPADRCCDRIVGRRMRHLRPASRRGSPPSGRPCRRGPQPACPATPNLALVRFGKMQRP